MYATPRTSYIMSDICDNYMVAKFEIFEFVFETWGYRLSTIQ